MSQLFSIYLYLDDHGIRPLIARFPHVLVPYVSAQARRANASPAKLFLLAKGLPFWAAHYVQMMLGSVDVRENNLARLRRRLGWTAHLCQTQPRACPHTWKLRKLTEKARRFLRETGFRHHEIRPIRTIPLLPDVSFNEDFPDLDLSLGFFQGRRLLESEVFRMGWESGAKWPRPLSEILELASLQGFITAWPGVTYDTLGHWRCSRCGETLRIQVEPGPCSSCGRKSCPVCLACASMGLSKGCQPLYQFPYKSPVARDQEWGRTAQLGSEGSEPVLSFQLTGPQKAAYEKLNRFVWSADKYCLLWAVCGAGKTEAVFGAIASCLARGQKVLFTVPRRDVAVELAPRISKAFPSRPVTVLAGGQTSGPLGQMVVGTTHQALRLGPVFGLVVLDEADAFPYTAEPALARAVRQCLAPGGKHIVMTATPDDFHFSQVKSGNWSLVVIPIRHHGRPLPVPELFLDRSWKGQGSPAIGKFPEEVDAKVMSGELVPLLVFVPTVKWGEFLATELTKRWPERKIGFVHAGSRDRDAIKQEFIAGKVEILVSTSILARGITVPGVNVLVVQADSQRIFGTASLVQMAGRAGRTSAHPHGSVWFIAAQKTQNITDAVAMITQANQMAMADKAPAGR